MAEIPIKNVPVEHKCESLAINQVLAKVNELDLKFNIKLEQEKLVEVENKKKLEQEEKVRKEKLIQDVKDIQEAHIKRLKRVDCIGATAVIITMFFISLFIIGFIVWNNTTSYERETECIIEKVFLNKSRDPMVNDILSCNEKEKIDSYFVLYTKENKDRKHVIEEWNKKYPVEGRYSCYKVKQLSEDYNNNCIPTPDHNNKVC